MLAAFGIQRIKEGHIEIVGLEEHLARKGDQQEETKKEYDSDSVLEGSAYIGSLVKKHFENEMAGWKTKSAPRWLTLKGAAVYSGLSSAGIGRLAAHGKIRSSLVSISGTKRGRRLVDRLSLDEFIESYWRKDEFFTWQGYPA